MKIWSFNALSRRLEQLRRILSGLDLRQPLLVEGKCGFSDDSIGRSRCNISHVFLLSHRCHVDAKMKLSGRFGNVEVLRLKRSEWES